MLGTEVAAVGRGGRGDIGGGPAEPCVAFVLRGVIGIIMPLVEVVGVVNKVEFDVDGPDRS